MNRKFKSEDIPDLLQIIANIIKQKSLPRIAKGYETVDVLPMPKESIEESTKARAAYIADYLLYDGAEFTTMATASRPITLEDRQGHRREFP